MNQAVFDLVSIVYNQTRSRQRQAQEFVIQTLVYSLWNGDNFRLPTGPLTKTQILETYLS